MEFAAKGDLLTNLIKKAKSNERIIEEKEIWRICRSVVSGLKMLHTRNIVHKDIKPQNILMMEDLSVKVSTIDLFVKLLIITPAMYSRNVNIDCRYGYISICRELGVQEHVGE